MRPRYTISSRGAVWTGSDADACEVIAWPGRGARSALVRDLLSYQKFPRPSDLKLPLAVDERIEAALKRDAIVERRRPSGTVPFQYGQTGPQISVVTRDIFGIVGDLARVGQPTVRHQPCQHPFLSAVTAKTCPVFPNALGDVE